MKTAVKELKERREKAFKDARAIAEKVDKEDREFTSDEKEEIKRLIDEAAGLKKQIDEQSEDDDLRRQIKELGDIVVPTTSDAPLPGTPKTPYENTMKSLGELFVENEKFKAFINQFPGGVIPESAKGISMPPVELKSLFKSRRGQKAPLTGADDASAGAFVQTDYSGILELLGRRPFTVRDVISVRQTGSDTVEFVRQLTRGNAAAPTAEATGVAASGAKPEGSMTFEKVTTSVKTIAEWIPATKRALSDAGQLMGLIDDELRADLQEEEEDQIINGAGTGENLTGILQTSGIQTQPWDTDLFVTTRKAVTKVETTGRSIVTAFLVNPTDDERFDLERDGDGRFYGAGPFAIGPKTLWGKPRIASEAVPVGHAIAGDFRRAVLWDREAATISISDSHADFFTRNLVAVLAEERVAFGVTRPTAFVDVDLTAA